MSRVEGMVRRALAPVPISFLVLLRILYGVLNVVLVGLYHHHGMIERYYVEPRMHFTYPGFSWVAPWPGDGMLVHHAALAVLALLVALGLFYRVAIVLLTVGLAHVFLIEQARYLNHYYLNILVGALLALTPAHRAWSIDARWRPSLRGMVTPAWTRWIFQLQIGLVYVYAGVAKLDGDWIRGLVLVRELRTKADLPVIGPLFTTDWIAPFMSWGGLLLDLFVVPFLLWRPTRWIAFAVAAGFHLTNATLFRIDIFPWFMMGATFLLFFADLLPSIGGRGTVETDRGSAAPPSRGQRVLLGVVTAYAVVQVLVPLRHHLYPGNANWTDHGHDFAWRMMLRAKTGWVREVTASYDGPDGTRVSEAIGIPRDPAFWATHWQFRKMAQTPDLILQFCHDQARRLREAGHTGVEIRADVVASLNGRDFQPLIDPTVDLAACTRSPLDRRWIVPLTTDPPPLAELIRRLDESGVRP